LKKKIVKERNNGGFSHSIYAFLGLRKEGDSNEKNKSKKQILRLRRRMTTKGNGKSKYGGLSLRSGSGWG
jgi:hypothetical protein